MPRLPARYLRRPMLAAVCLAIVAIVGEHSKELPRQQADADLARREAWRSVCGHLDAVDARAGKDVAESVAIVSDFLESRKRGSRPFAKSVLGLQSKWKLVYAHMPLTDAEEHVRFLREQFELHVMSGDDLRFAVESAVRFYLAGQEAADNRLLVRVRADLVGLPECGLPAANRTAAFEERYRRLIADVSAKVAAETGNDVNRLTVSVIAQDVAFAVAKRVLSRLAASGALLSSGAAISWASFGISIVAAIAIDWGIDWGLKLAGHDPEAKVAERVEKELTALQAELVDGPAGLRNELTRLAQARSKVRREALRELVFGKDAPEK